MIGFLALDRPQGPGLALAIVRENGYSEYGTWGKRSEDGSRTLFNIASCLKAFVAASLGILIKEFAQGRNTTSLPTGLSTLSWQTKLADVIPGNWELSDPWASKKANLIDILTHVSGLSRNYLKLAKHDLTYKRPHSALDTIRNLRNLRPSHELREKLSYDNQMYTVGAHVITALSGVPFTEFVKDRILKPLRMTQSTYSIDEAAQSGNVIGVKADYRETWRRHLDTNATIVPHRVLETITSAHSIVYGTPTRLTDTIMGYGLGWARFSLAAHDLIYHNGGAPGVSADIIIPVFDDVGIVSLANADEKYPVLHDINVAVLRKLAGNTNESIPDNLLIYPWARFVTSGSRHAHKEDPSTTHELPRLDLTGTYDDVGYGTLTFPTNTAGQYLVDFGSLYPTGYGRNTTPFAHWITRATAHFVVEDGIFVSRVQSAAYQEDPARQITFINWGSEWLIHQTQRGYLEHGWWPANFGEKTWVRTHPLPKGTRSFTYANTLTRPPDGGDHPLWRAATARKKDDRGRQTGQLLYSRRTTSTALQLAADYAFSGTYVIRFRPSDPEEASACPCGALFKTDTHILYDCPHKLIPVARHLSRIVYNGIRTPCGALYRSKNSHRLLTFLQISRAMSKPDPGPVIEMSPEPD
ncbi:beta-lactamase/transpeptidase-like protein [Lactarius vividus]|nr:beta-lactamase/transpeptidase-like protein [Lactarius vividus]